MDLFGGLPFHAYISRAGFTRRLRHLLALDRLLGAQLHRQQHAGGVLPDGLHHLVVHVEALDAVFHHGVVLAVAAQVDALAQLLHRVDVLHPLGIHGAQQDHALKFAHQRRAVTLFLVGADLFRAVGEGLDHVLAADGVQVVCRIAEIVLLRQPAQIVAAQAVQIPVVRHVARQIQPGVRRDGFAQHRVDAFGDVLALQHLAALAVDDLTLAVHYVVKLQHVLADGEVARLQLLLRALDGVRDHLVLDGHILLDAEGIHNRAHAIAAKEAHQVVLQADEEAACAGVALTAGAAAQLVVDAAALVALGADDEKAPRAAHSLGLLRDLFLMLLHKLGVPRAHLQDFLVGGVGVAVALDDQFLGETLLAQVGLRHVFGVAAQHDIGAAPGHVRGNRHCAELARLRDDLGLFLVVFRVQHLVPHAALFQKLAQMLALFDGDGAHQHGLALLVALQHLIDHGVKLGALRFVHNIVVVGARHGLVRGHLHHLQAVDLLELGGLGLCGARHAGQLFVHAEVVLERDGGERLALARDGDALLRLDGLVQALVVAAAQHQAARELVDDDHLAVAHHVIDVALHHAARLDGLVDVVLQRHIFAVGEVFHIEVFFGLRDAAGRKRGRLFLFVHDIVAVHLLVLLLLVVQLGYDAGLQAARELVGQLVEVGAGVALPADDERRARLVDEDGVHLVHDGVIVAALHHLLLVGDHVVAQVIEAELVVGAVGDIGGIGGLALLRRDAVHDEPDGEAQKPVHLAHPFAVALGEVIVHGDNVHAAPRKRV